MIAPSILAADFGRLREQVEEVRTAGAQIVHIDVMDGHFVPPLSMGPLVCAALRDLGMHLEVHLMVERPEGGQIAAFADAGAQTIIVHAEATPAVHLALQAVRERGALAGLAVNPATPIDIFAEVEVDLALLMTVNPGWGGQSFIPSSLAKLERLRALLGPEAEIEVDGGIDAHTAGPCARAGATRFVAGTAIFGTAHPAAAYAGLEAALAAASA